MAITSTSALIAALPGQRLNFFKQMSAALGSNWANRYISLWLHGGNPGAGAAPGSQNGVVPTDATTGALTFTNAGGANTLYLGRCAPVCPSGAKVLTLYDRLLAASGFTNTATPAAPVAVNRTAPNDGGVYKNELWVEIYSALTTSRTVTFTYTDQDGNTGNVSGTVTLPASVPSCMIPVPLAAGDTGVRSVQVVTCSGATGGDFGFTVLRALAEFDLTNGSDIQDAIALGMPDIPSDACLALMALATGNSIADVTARSLLVQG